MNFELSVVLKIQYLGSRLPLNISHFRDFAATVKFYTHPNDVLGIFPSHNNLMPLLGSSKVTRYRTWLPDWLYIEHYGRGPWCRG